MNVIRSTLAFRYAKAFMNTFGDSILLEDLDNVAKCAQFFMSKSELVFFLNLSLIPLDAKKDMIEQIFQRYNLPFIYNKICMLLIEHQRVILLPMVFRMIKSDTMKKHKIFLFDVKSSHCLDSAEQKNLEGFLQKNIEGTIVCSYKVDKTLIAGVRISSETLLWEDSVKKRLTKFKNALRR